MNTPTPEQKIQVYEKLLDRIAFLYDLGDNKSLRTILEKINKWSNDISHII